MKRNQLINISITSTYHNVITFPPVTLTYVTSISTPGHLEGSSRGYV